MTPETIVAATHLASVAAPPVYIQLLMLLGVSTFVVLLLSRLRLSPILGYMVAGVLIGPSGFAVMGDVTMLHPAAELGIVCLLFIIGLELSWARLTAMRNLVFGLGGMQVLFSAAALSLIGHIFLDLQPFPAMLMGTAFALSSTAIVLQLLSERHEVKTKLGRAAFAVLLLQDLVAIPLIAIATLGTPPDDASDIALAMLKAIALLMFFMSVAHLASRMVLHRIASTKNNELFTAFTLFVVIGMGVATQSIGLSLALGAFLAGLLLSGTAYRHKIEADIAPFKGLLLGLFFMTVGMEFDLHLLTKAWEDVLLGVLVLTLTKGVVIFGIGKAIGRSTVGSARLALFLAGAGEFAFVVITAARVAGIIENADAQYLLAVTGLSLMLTPIFNILDRLWQSHTRRQSTKELRQPAAVVLEKPQVVVAGFGRMGQVIGQELAAQNIDYLAIDSDIERVAKAQAQDLPVYYGVSQDLNLLRQLQLGDDNALIITLDNPEDVTETARVVRAEWPGLPILSRAYDQAHAHELQLLGVNVTVVETVAASIALAEAAIVLAEADSELKSVR